MKVCSRFYKVLGNGVFRNNYFPDKVLNSLKIDGAEVCSLIKSMSI